MQGEAILACSTGELDWGCTITTTPQIQVRILLLHLPRYLLSVSTVKIYLGIAG